MTNAELIKALRYCAEHEGCDYYIAKDCPREDTWVCGADCEQILMNDAADAREAAEKRIDGLQKLVDINTERCEALRKQLRESHENYEKHLNELEAQLPKEGEWIESEDLESVMKGKVVCSICGEPQFALELTNEFVRMKNSKTNYCPNCGAKMRGEQK